MAEQFFEHTLTLRPVIDDCADILRMVEDLQAKLETAQSQIVQLQDSMFEAGKRFAEAQATILVRDATIETQQGALDKLAREKGELLDLLAERNATILALTLRMNEAINILKDPTT